MATHSVEGDELRVPSWIAIRTILMEHWDPIGVYDEPFAQDEYDSYIPKLKSLVRGGGDVEALMDYLDEIATERMGFTPQRERGREAALLLAALHPKLEPL